MLRHPWRLFAVALVALVLAACQVTIQPPVFDPPIEATVSAQDTTSPQPRLSNVTVQSGQTLYFRVNVPTARDLLYGEAVGSGLRVRWLTSTGSTLAVSESPTFFAGSMSDLATGSAVPEAEAVVEPSVIVNYSCVGPCVAIAPSASTYYLSVYNRTDSSRTFNLFAYTFEANDLNDRGSDSNQTDGAAVPFAIGTEYGAIELVGDRDWYAYTGPTGRELVFNANNAALGLRLGFEDGATITPGSPAINLFAGDRFYVFSAEGRAGPSSPAGYTIQIRNP